jgi:hypothetical protein
MYCMQIVVSLKVEDSDHFVLQVISISLCLENIRQHVNNCISFCDKVLGGRDIFGS